MTFLELCRRVREDSGVSGDGPAAVTDQRGILQRIVNWVKLANDEIQLEHDDWLFMNYVTTQTLTAGQAEFPLFSIGAPSLRTLAKVYAGGQEVPVISYSDWLDNLPRFSASQTGASLMAVTLTPDQRLLVYPVLSTDVVVTIRGYTLPTPLLNNDDVPNIPAQYHEAIVARALMYYADYEEDTYRYNRATADYEKWLKRLSETQLPRMRVF